MVSFHPFGLLTLAAFELVLGVRSTGNTNIFAWLKAPFVTAPVKFDENAGPEAMLLGQLQSVDTTREPEKALPIHEALADMLRTDGAWNDQAILHLEAARDTAVRSGDADSILATRLKIAEAYIEMGRPKDAEAQLQAKPLTNTLLTPDNVWEYMIKLDRASGRASFELGDILLASETFEAAAQIANQPDDIVRLACDIAAAHACLGHAQKALEPLRNALEVLGKAGKADSIPVSTLRSLAIEVHTRRAEALHSMGDQPSAKSSYEKVFTLQAKPTSSSLASASSIKASIENMENGIGPSLRCPGGALKQRFHLPAQSASGNKAFQAKIAALLKTHDYRKAEYELWNNLEAQKRPYKSLDATSTLISLGNLYLIPEKKSYYKAAQMFQKALPAALACCGASSPEAKAAFEGLSYVQDVIPAKDRAKSAVAMQEYLSAVESSASATDLGSSMQLV